MDANQIQQFITDMHTSQAIEATVEAARATFRAYDQTHGATIAAKSVVKSCLKAAITHNLDAGIIDALEHAVNEMEAAIQLIEIIVEGDN